MKDLLAACNSFFGCVTPPQGVNPDFEIGSVDFANKILRIVIIGAGLYAFINLIIAGYGFMGAAGDVKKVQQSWEKIWQSLLGLALVAGSFVLAAIFGKLIFGDYSAILKPTQFIYGPTTTP